MVSISYYYRDSIFYFLLKIFNSNLWLIGFICLLLEGYFILINEFGFINHYSPVLTHTFIRLLVYFYVGYVLAKFPQLKELSKSTLLPILICLLIIFIAENYFIHYIGGVASNEEVISTLPTSVCLVLYAININPNLEDSKSIRNLSTFMYCAQVWPIEILKIIFLYLDIMYLHILFFIVALGSILIGYWIFTILITKPNFRILKYAV
ncbi:hypothetical protein [Limosilactobacillus vaginalis]|uniref:hypothetical protein n=1 Tax=Limosilactobacillus vaginalis TaxID=1633 RepID=UPI0022A9612F|nr:hypothetical protein [Limosilactobacillus vaginalis]MCZ2465775.1 hypothetical protein [Limosilactobacillus vaginalis]